MLQLIYGSNSRYPMSELELNELLKTTRVRNEAAGITGMLLYSDGSFLQVLEGPADAVEATYARIHRDPRHHGVLLLLRCEVAEREFGDWSMAFAHAEDDDMGEIVGRSSLRDEDFLRNVAPGRARTLLRVFRDKLSR